MRPPNQSNTQGGTQLFISMTFNERLNLSTQLFVQQLVQANNKVRKH